MWFLFNVASFAWQMFLHCNHFCIIDSFASWMFFHCNCSCIALILLCHKCSCIVFAPTSSLILLCHKCSCIVITLTLLILLHHGFFFCVFCKFFNFLIVTTQTSRVWLCHVRIYTLVFFLQVFFFLVVVCIDFNVGCFVL